MTGADDSGDGARSEDGVGHAMNDFFVIRANGCQDAFQGSPGLVSLPMDKIIRAKPDSSVHGNGFSCLKIDILRRHRTGFMVFLEDVILLIKTTDGTIHDLRPGFAR